jgi:hypothetical protein
VSDHQLGWPKWLSYAENVAEESLILSNALFDRGPVKKSPCQRDQKFFIGDRLRERADQSNRRASPKDYAVWEIHPVMALEGLLL